MRRVFQAIGIIWLVAVVTIGVGGTWLTHNDDTVAIAVLGAAANYDPDASTLEQAKNIVGGYSSGKALVAEQAALAERRRADREQARQRRIDKAYAKDGWGNGSGKGEGGWGD